MAPRPPATRQGAASRSSQALARCCKKPVPASQAWAATWRARLGRAPAPQVREWVPSPAPGHAEPTTAWPAYLPDWPAALQGTCCAVMAILHAPSTCRYAHAPTHHPVNTAMACGALTGGDGRLRSASPEVPQRKPWVPTFGLNRSATPAGQAAEQGGVLQPQPGEQARERPASQPQVCLHGRWPLHLHALIFNCTAYLLLPLPHRHRPHRHRPTGVTLLPLPH